MSMILVCILLVTAFSLITHITKVQVMPSLVGKNGLRVGIW